jgi:hypothetical protein
VATHYAVKRHMVSTSGGHEHVGAVKEESGTEWTRAEVVSSITAGDSWYTKNNGLSARIHKVACSCGTTYLSTDPDSTKADNLDSLPKY